MDLESAVAGAWRTTAEQMPGVRLVIDRCADHPATPEMERAMNRAREHEWMRLATLAGLASAQDPSAVAAGRRVEDLAREGLQQPLEAPESPTEPLAESPVEARKKTSGPSFVDRIRAVLAA